jgi:hypothetical protein
MGEALFEHFYSEYLIFVRGGVNLDSLIQISGVSIYDYMKDNFGKDSVYQQPSRA